MVFLPQAAAARGAAAGLIERCLASEGLAVAGWRNVPVDAGVLGDQAAAGAAGRAPGDRQPARPHRPARTSSGACSSPAEPSSRRSAPRPGLEIGPPASLSSRTVVYKGLVRGSDLGRFYPDLGQSALAVDARHLPPAVLDQHPADLAPRPAIPLPRPQRRDQHDPGQPPGDGRPIGHPRRRPARLPPRPGGRGGTRRCSIQPVPIRSRSTRPSSCCSWPAGHCRRR